MDHHSLVELGSILTLGVFGQWLAWRLRLPSILVLLILGFLAGPVFKLLDPDHLLGSALFPLVSLSVAIILFEGGMSLSIRDLRHIGRDLWSLVGFGVVIAGLMGIVCAKFILGFDWPLATLTGALLVVTGPTVVIPLLRHVRPRGRVGTLVRWEGILNDPVGVLLAVLVFEAIASEGLASGALTVSWSLIQTAIIGLVSGLLGAWALVMLLRSERLPDRLHSPIALGIVVVVYVLSDIFQAESGLFSATVLGIAVANQRRVEVYRIVEFKETLQVLLIASLFILLSARIELESLTHLGWNSLLFLVALIVVVRPATIFLSTIHSGLNWREKTFLAWMAPRGIVAAATASVFALRLGEMGVPEAESLVPVVFLVIVGTVSFYGLTAGPVARYLGLAGQEAQGCLIIGAHAWARAIAKAVQDAGFGVIMMDRHRGNLRKARLAGIPSVYGNVLTDDLPTHLPQEDLGKLLAFTSNEELNSLAALSYREDWGAKSVYQLAPEEDSGDPNVSTSQVLRGRYLFAPSASYNRLSRRWLGGATIKSTKLTEEFPFAAFQQMYKGRAVPLFIVRGKNLLVIATDAPTEPKPGDSIIAMVDAESAPASA